MLGRPGVRGWCDSVSCQPPALSFTHPALERKMRCGWEPSLPPRSPEKPHGSRSWRNAVISADRGESRAQGPGGRGLRERGAVGTPRCPLGALRARPQPPLSLAFPLTGPCGAGGCRASPLLLPGHWSAVLSSALTGAPLVFLDSGAPPPGADDRVVLTFPGKWGPSLDLRPGIRVTVSPSSHSRTSGKERKKRQRAA